MSKLIKKFQSPAGSIDRRAPSLTYQEYMSGEPQMTYWMREVSKEPEYVQMGRENTKARDEVYGKPENRSNYVTQSKVDQQRVAREGYIAKQKALAALGLYKNKIDGLWGRGSKAAETEALAQGYKWDGNNYTKPQEIKPVSEKQVQRLMNKPNKGKDNWSWSGGIMKAVGMLPGLGDLGDESSPAFHLGRKMLMGKLGESANFTDLPEENMKILRDQSQWVLDNYDQILATNAQRQYRDNNRKMGDAITAQRNAIKQAGGLEQYLKLHPSEDVSFGFNMADYKNQNQSRFPEGTVPKYANFDYSNSYGDHAGFALHTPLGKTENIIGNGHIIFNYNPETGQIQRRMKDSYNFNQHAAKSESKETALLRDRAGKNQYLGDKGKYANNLTYDIDLGSGNYEDNWYITNPSDFGQPSFGSDSEKAAMQLGIASMEGKSKSEILRDYLSSLF